MLKNARHLIGFALALTPFTLSGQEGTIQFDRVAKIQFDAPQLPDRIREMIPEQGVKTMLLHFTGTESLMIPAPEEESEETAAPAARSDRITPAALLQRLRAGSTRRSDSEDLMQVHVDTPSGAIVESRKFMGRDFIIEDERPSFAWRLTTDQAEHLGMMVQKATTVHDGMQVEAWFTPEIPVPGGPAQFGGLPGMILVLSVNDGQLMYTATSIDLEGLDPSVIKKPTDGDEMSRVEYEEMVAEKLEERRQRSSRRRRRGGGGQ